jgi:hypothetical protein
MSSNNTSSKPRKTANSRWWESYFVRYLAGTAVGAIVVLFLAKNSPVSPGQDGLADIVRILCKVEFKSAYITMLAIFGFAFCYVASAPILVFHALRGNWIKWYRQNEKTMAKLNCMTIVKIILFIIFLAVIVPNIPVFIEICYPTSVKWLVFGTAIARYLISMKCLVFVTAVAIFVSQLFLLLALFDQKSGAFEYYSKLAHRRAVADDARIEYVESYRHLRENGNAFFIILLELLLGAMLFYSNSFGLSWSIVLAIWIFPAAFVWLFGTLLESKLII